MTDKIFIDTNILIYYISDDIPKKSITKDLIVNNENSVISSQVITEFVATTIKKQILSHSQSVNYAIEFMNIFNFAMISKGTIKSSFELMKKYKYSNWDSLILASALENNC